MAKANIMIVEDEAIVGEELKISLEDMGYTVTSIVKSGEQAIEKAEQDCPDLILMDIRLKGQMDGIEAAELIRSRLGIPVVFLTAYADDDKLERAKLTMPFGYILKPFQDRDLEVTIEIALYTAKIDAERKQMQDELAKHRDHLEELVKERTKELQIVINSMSGREVRMVELKKVIKKLRSQLEGAGMKPVADDPWKEVGKDYT
jgi:CheY-like chemotaxis protein